MQGLLRHLAETTVSFESNKNMTKNAVPAVCHYKGKKTIMAAAVEADLLTVSYDQVHRLALLMQACLTALSGLLLLRRIVTPTCYSCTKLEGAARSSFQHVDIQRRHAASTQKGALNTSMHMSLANAIA